MVGCLQFHDITRQQIEHVVEALEQLRSGSGRIQPQSRTILAIQSSQLASAAALFDSSMERTEQSLENMVTSVRTVTEASRSLMGVSAGERDSFFLDMEARFTRILDLLRMCMAEQVEMEKTVSSLEVTMAAMSKSVNEIGQLELRIQRIATNAVIRAVHLGDAGDGLNVIAEIMGRLAVDSSHGTEDASRAVQSMLEEAAKVREGAARRLAERDEGAVGLIAEMRGAILGLHTSGEQSFSRVSSIASSGDLLVKEIEGLQAGFSARELVARVAGKARADLETLAGPAAAGTHPAGDLEHLARRYTMQTERDVHDAVALGTALAGSSVPAGQTAASLLDEGLGDNVELF